ncbi:Sec-independent protein translocase protein TatB [Pseudomonas wadenswilerensis]|uniref:Sec-independent protein translocase protein TatB n=1 Tax=Pseudomonas wadenswilerensis TaxID=1785161 RepID=A0A380T816_9PSED|nr:Sec-independent protein translocase protein TatB [Pseudomonas wadenswilerensis]UVM22318.1 Sec-independent protein translocase protein TatB [Pseudomonas wadenswilerensis]SUQ65678.1 Sec-independent protein translocase protein TatB [Pseudomonas wadenswilerensis]
MFGISFSELLLVGLVALLVLGPERLPGAARTAGLWIGRLKRSFNAIKQEVEREIGADDIRRQLHNEHILSMEQEARKILNPNSVTPEPPASPVANGETAPAPAPASSETPPPVVSAPTEPTQPPRAP